MAAHFASLKPYSGTALQGLNKYRNYSIIGRILDGKIRAGCS